MVSTHCGSDWGPKPLSDLLEQLRVYGEAVEAEAARLGGQAPVAVSHWRRRSVLLLAAAVLVAVVGVAGVTLRLVRDESGGRDKLVATIPGQPPAVPVTGPPTTAAEKATPEPTTTLPALEATPTSTAPTTTVRNPGLVIPTPTTVAAPTTPASTDASPSPSTTVTPARVTSVRGTATWVGRDPRAAVIVAACPVGQTEPGCPGFRITEAAADGSFELLLPTTDSPGSWKIVAGVVVDAPYSRSCVFSCTWRTMTIGPAATISDSAPTDSLSLTVTARVVDAFVRDRNNQPFEGGGLMVTDTRCPQSPCPDGQAPNWSAASATDGAVRFVVDPSATYELMGIAQNTGWPNPQNTRPDGGTSWYSPTITAKGSAIQEGQVFFVNGAPA